MVKFYAMDAFIECLRPIMDTFVVGPICIGVWVFYFDHDKYESIDCTLLSPFMFDD